MKSLFCILLLLGSNLLADTFSVPQPNTPLQFPQDHGSHPDYRIEWWYITGHLFTPAQRPFGFQATFFRFAGDRDDPVAPQNIFMAHMALTDIQESKFYHQEKLNREGWNAYAEVGRLDLRNANWTLIMPNATSEIIELKATIQGDVVFDLAMMPVKPRVIFGPDGVSRKGSDPDAVSYYISFTRLGTSGTLKVGKEEFQVTGEAWMDHEISSNQLSDNLAGWDWTAIQLDDGREIKAYRLRNHDGSTDAYSRFIWIGQDGQYQEFTPDVFSWNEVGYWSSPVTGAAYPIEVIIEGPSPEGRKTAYHLKPFLENQEITSRNRSLAYWEGACIVVDDNGNTIGRAYLELAGYAEPLNEP